jgi:dihydrolipoamide dehydrogenase
VAEESNSTFDVVILGGGNAGYSAAFRAVKLGLSVAMVEKDKVGGTCLHRGCIPTKALLHAAEFVDEIKGAGDFGILVQEPQVDWGKVLGFKDSVVGRMYKGLSGLVTKKKIELLQGDGRLIDAKTVSVKTADGERAVSAEKGVILAPGAFPRDLPFIEADGDRVHNSNHALVAEDIPSSIVIVGGNYIGLEFASVYRSFGADVTVIEMLPKIAPSEDDDISDALLKLLQRRGIKFHLGISVTGAKPSDHGIDVEIEKQGKTEVLSADRMFVAIGRAPRTDGIGLEEVGVTTEKGYIVTDANFRTSVDGIFAIGDAIHIPEFGPHLQLAHVAFIEGMKVAERLAGEDPAPVDYRNVPHIIYSQPEVAAVGLTEQQARDAGLNVTTARYPFAANARALMLGGGQGFVKTIADKDGAVVGVHVIGNRASDLITEAQLVTSWEAYPSELAELIHPHPTLSEAIGETFLELAGKPLHH